MHVMSQQIAGQIAYDLATYYIKQYFILEMCRYNISNTETLQFLNAIWCCKMYPKRYNVGSYGKRFSRKEVMQSYQGKYQFMHVIKSLELLKGLKPLKPEVQ